MRDKRRHDSSGAPIRYSSVDESAEVDGGDHDEDDDDDGDDRGRRTPRSASRQRVTTPLVPKFLNFIGRAPNARRRFRYHTRREV